MRVRLSRRRAGAAMIVVAAFLWGLAEATAFFIVPDVAISAASVGSARRGLAAALAALAGALIGGAGLFLFARADPEAARALVLAVPGVSEALLSRADRLLDKGLLAGMVAGSVSGLPYKLFVVEAAGAGATLTAFLAASAPARLLRFVAVVALTRLVAGRLLRRWSMRARLATLAAFWLAFYVAYFAAVGW